MKIFDDFMTKQKEPLIIQGFYLKILYLIHYSLKRAFSPQSSTICFVLNFKLHTKEIKNTKFHRIIFYFCRIFAVKSKIRGAMKAPLYLCVIYFQSILQVYVTCRLQSTFHM